MDQFNHSKPLYAGVANDPAKQQAFDSMFSYFTIPVPKPDQSQKSGRTQQYQIREGEKYFLLTPELLKLKQSDAAAKLDIHPSTFSKKWRQSLPDRKWPYRKHCKIERQISRLKEQGQAGDTTNDHIQELINLREKNLEPAVIVVSDDVPAKDAAATTSTPAITNGGTTSAIDNITTTTTTPTPTPPATLINAVPATPTSLSTVNTTIAPLSSSSSANVDMKTDPSSFDSIHSNNIPPAPPPPPQLSANCAPPSHTATAETQPHLQVQHHDTAITSTPTLPHASAATPSSNEPSAAPYTATPSSDSQGAAPPDHTRNYHPHHFQ